MNNNKQVLLRSLPAVDQLLKENNLNRLINDIPRKVVLEAVQEVIDYYRELIISCETPGKLDRINIEPARLEEEAITLARRKSEFSLYPVVNATGTVLHTNLGRAPLSQEASRRVAEVAGAYSNLEMNMESGERGSRMDHIEKIICELTGAEGSLVVNNNAAAVLLVLNTLARGKEVIVSRGQLVEIGGSFRIPEVMIAGGARLVEVGATNKCYLRDYEGAVSDDTAMFLKVHTSNYRVVGFTTEVQRKELVELGRMTGLPVVEDMGSGAMVDVSKMSLPSEPEVRQSLEEGVSLVTFSGDKLLGGPQAGIIVGDRAMVDKCRRNQMMRALRVDKMVLVALESTLRIYREPDRAVYEVPVLNMLRISEEELKKKARSLLRRLRRHFPGNNYSLWEGKSSVGGGALPLVELPGVGVSVEPLNMSVSEFARCLRTGSPSVVARVQHDRIVLDVRTLLPGDENRLEIAFRNIRNDKNLIMNI